MNMMDRGQICENICWYDPRYTYFIDLEPHGVDQPEPRDGCFCDNCFYGKDRLALAALSLLDELEKCVETQKKRMK